MEKEGFLDMAMPQLDKQVFIDGVEFKLISADSELDWANGNIERPEISEREYEALIDLAPQALVRVSEANLACSGCTDGRCRVHNLDGSDAEHFQKTVGADIMELFSAAEALGSAFYGDELVQASTMDRFQYVVDYASENGLFISTHEGCGARAGFATVMDNGIAYASDMSIVEAEQKRISQFSGDNVEKDSILMVASGWKSSDLSGYDAEVARQIIIDKNGTSAVQVLKEDHTPNHGHNEAFILRVNAPGYTFSTRKFKELLEEHYPDLAHLQGFSVNDDRINEKLAPIMGDNDKQRRLAAVAMHYFADSGHATLSKGLPTIILKKTV